MDLKEAQNTLFAHLRKSIPNAEEWVTIRNGDVNGHRWPRQESFMVLCTPRSFVHRLLRAESTADVQHFIYDEVHDASAWTLFVLSLHLYEISENERIKAYLMTATPDTPIFRAVQQAVAQASPGSPIFGSRRASAARRGTAAPIIERDPPGSSTRETRQLAMGETYVGMH